MTDTLTGPAVTLDEETLQGRLRKAKVEQSTGTIELPIPGYNGQLVARYRTLDWKERRKITLDTVAATLPERELATVAAQLVASCEGVDAHVEGQVAPVPHKLGAALASYLGEDGAETDIQGVFLVFPSELAIMNHMEELSNLQKDAVERADGAIAKN